MMPDHSFFPTFLTILNVNDCTICLCVGGGIEKLSFEINYNDDQFDKCCNETLINMLTYIMTLTHT